MKMRNNNNKNLLNPKHKLIYLSYFNEILKYFKFLNINTFCKNIFVFLLYIYFLNVNIEILLFI